MAKRLMVRRAGGSLTVTIPKDMADRLHLEPGSELHAVENEQGILITTYDPDFERVMEAYRKVAKRYQNALRELAK